MVAADSESEKPKLVADRGLGRQLIWNTVATTCYYGINLVLGLWYARFVLGKLGVSMYSVVPLAGAFTNYLQFATTGIAGSVGRFVVMDVAAGDQKKANRTFNTYIVATQYATLFLSACIALIAWLVVPTLQYPEGQLLSTRLVFIAVLGSAITGVWSMCFDSAIWVSGRLDLRYWIFTIDLVTRLGLVFLMFTTFQPQLWHIGVATIASSLVGCSLFVLAWRYLTPEFYIRRREFDPERLKEITRLGGWLLVTTLGSALMFNTDLVVINKTLGNVAQGYYGIILSWLNILRGLFVSLGMLLSPSVVALQASGELDRLYELGSKAMRLQGMLISLPVGILCGLSAPVLNWWLGPDFVHLAPLTWLILVPLALEGAYYPIWQATQTQESVRYPAILTLGLGAANVLISVCVAKFTPLGVYGVALCSAVISVLRHGVFLPIYTARILARPWHAFLTPLAQTVIQVALTGVIGFLAAPYVKDRSLLSLALVASVCGCIAAGPALAQLSSQERARLLKLVLHRR